MTANTPPIAEITIRALMAEEAIASTEIENGPMPERERFITKMRLMFPDCEADVWGEYYDHEQAKKERASA